MEMKGKVYAITGAGSGIGRATVLRLAELEVAGIAISDVNEAGLKETGDLCSGFETKVVADRVDVSKPKEVNAWISKTMSTFGRLDGAANVAGIAGGEGQITESIDQTAWERMISVNLTGVMHCMRAQLPHMLERGGSIVNVSSTSGLRGLPGNAAYSSSKFGVIGLTESTAAEYGKRGVRVNALLPGPIDTQIFRDGVAKGLFNEEIISAGTLMGRMGQAAEVARVLVFLLSEDASYVTGAHWAVDGGYSACGFYKAG